MFLNNSPVLTFNFCYNVLERSNFCSVLHLKTAKVRDRFQWFPYVGGKLQFGYLKKKKKKEKMKLSPQPLAILVQYLLSYSYLYQKDIEELGKKTQTNSFLFFQCRLLILLGMVGIWVDCSVRYSGKCSVAWKISFDNPTKGLFVKEVQSPWQKECITAFTQDNAPNLVGLSSEK